MTLLDDSPQLCRLGHHNSVTAKHLTDRQRREREQSMDTVYTHESAQFLLVDVADDDDIYQAADEGLEVRHAARL